jgi:small conductance mechanosensitive channel
MKDQILFIWNNYHETVFSIGGKVTAACIVIFFGFSISKGLKNLIKKASASKLDNTVSSILNSIITYGILIIVIIMTLNIFGVNTASLIAVLGAAGIAVGLALKDTLGNIAAGIIMIFLGNYRIGEFIQFNSFNGTVKQINLFSTVLETPDGIYVSTLNSSILGSTILNFSRNGKRRMELSVRISYSDSIDAAFGVLNDLVKSETRFLNEPPAQVVVQSLQDGCINLVVRAWAGNADYWDVYWKYTRIIKEKIEEAGLSIPYPRQEIFIQNTQRY